MPSASHRPERIAIVTRRFSWTEAGGGEVSVTLLAHHLARRGHHVTIVATETKGAPEGAPEGLTVQTVPAITPAHVKDALREARPHVVHSYNMESAPATVRAARALGIPVVVTVNSAWATCLFADMYRPGHGVCTTCTIGGVRECFERRPPEQIGRRVPALVGWGEVQRRLFHVKRADALVVLSKASKEMLVRNGVPAGKVRVVPNMENAAFRPQAEAEAEAEADDDDDDERVLYVGALSFPKGTDVLVRAFAKVAAERPRARLVLAGQGSYRSTLEALARELGIADRVEFAGYVRHDALPALYRSARAIAFPVRSEEAFGRVILEAWGAGVPIVASDLSAPGEIVTHDENGLLVPPEDADALAAALVRVLRDDALARRLVQSGRGALAAYAPDRVVPRILDAYREAMRA